MKRHAASVNFESLGFGVEFREPSLLPRQHAHADIELILADTGGIEHLLGGRRVTCDAGELVLFWAGIPHQPVHVAPGSRCFFLHFPVTWLLEWPLPQAFTQDILQGRVARWSGAPLQGVRRRFDEWLEDHLRAAPAGPSESRSIMQIELQALVRRLAMDPAAAPLPHDSAIGSRVDRIASHLARRYRERITAAEVGRVAGVHPNHAMRIFSQAFGISLWSYLGRLRTAHARYLLATTPLKVIDVAAESGFTSIGRFYEVFRRNTGLSPQEFRRAGTSGWS